MEASKPKKPWWIFFFLAAAIITSISAFTEAGSLLQLNFGNSTYIYFNETESQLNGTVLVNGSPVCTVASGCGGAVTDLNNYTTATSFVGNILTTTRDGMSSLTAGLPNNSITLACQNITGSASNLCTITPGGSSSITFNNGTGINITGNSTNVTVGIAGLKACNPVTEYSTYNGSEWFCDNDGGGTDTNNYTSNITVNSTGTTYQINLERQGMTNLTATFSTTAGSGNISGNISPNTIPYWNGSQLINSSITQNSTSAIVTGDLTVQDIEGNWQSRSQLNLIESAGNSVLAGIRSNSSYWSINTPGGSPTASTFFTQSTRVLAFIHSTLSGTTYSAGDAAFSNGVLNQASPTLFLDNDRSAACILCNNTDANFSVNGSFRISNSTGATSLYTNGQNNRVGIGTISPTTELHVQGTINATTSVTASNASFGDYNDLLSGPVLALSRNVQSGSLLRLYRTPTAYTEILAPSGTPSQTIIQSSTGQDNMILYVTSSGNITDGDVSFPNDVRLQNGRLAVNNSFNALNHMFEVVGTTNLSGEVIVAGNITPQANITQSIGSNASRWKDIWLANSTIYLGSLGLTDNNGVLNVNGAPIGGLTSVPVVNLTQVNYSNNSGSAQINISLTNGTLYPISIDTTGTGGLSGGVDKYLAVWTGPSTLTALLLNASHINVSNTGVADQVLALNSTLGLYWKTDSTGSGGTQNTTYNTTFTQYGFTYMENATQIGTGTLMKVARTNNVEVYGNHNVSNMTYQNNFSRPYGFQTQEYGCYESDFFGSAGTSPFTTLTISSGAIGQQIAREDDHMGAVTLRDSTTANGGAFIGLSGSTSGDITPKVNDEIRGIIRLESGKPPTVTTRSGFFDTASSADATDGCHILWDSTANTATARCRAAGVTTSNATTYTFSNSTFYGWRVIHYNSTTANFTIWSDTGTVLLDVGLKSGVNTAATNFGIISTQSTTDAAAALVVIDYMGFCRTYKPQRAWSYGQ